MLQRRLSLSVAAPKSCKHVLAGTKPAQLFAKRPLETRRAPRVTCKVSRRELIGGTSGLLGSTVCVCPACSAAGPEKASPPSLYQRFFAYYMATSMGEYEEKVSPWKRELFEKLLQGRSEQRMMEIGMGAGPNLKYLASALQKDQKSETSKGLEIVGVDPNTAMQPYAREAAQNVGLGSALSLYQGQAEDLPFESNSFDAAVCTLVLCSVKDPQQAVNELLRVLRPGGRCLFIEHVAAPWETQPLLRAQQTLLNPLQRALADGCNLTRDTRGLIERSAWTDCYLISENLEGMGLVAPHVRGIAVK